MSPGPLRRVLGAIGLLLLAPVALRLVDGSLEPFDAAVRAVATLLAVVVVGRLLSAWLATVAHGYDTQQQEDASATAAQGAGS
jgi:hypothetical protein